MTLKVPEYVHYTNVALIDGDILLYRNGFAGEKNGNPDPLEHVLHSVKVTINSILADTESRTCKVYLTGKGNFREDVAYSRPYKGTRSSVKPYHYNNIKDYLIERWEAEIVEGIEADDMMSIQHCMDRNNTIICTLDKDLLQVPGYHYDWAKELPRTIYRTEGYKRFYRQLITGDTVDNIPGIPRGGEKLADKTLDQVNNILTMHELVYDLYRDRGLDEDYFNEQATLLWMMRGFEDSWARARERIESNFEIKLSTQSK